MELHRQAEFPRRVEDAPYLRRREGDLLAEGIDGIDKTCVYQRGQPGDGGVEVGVGLVGKLRRQRMRRQAGGAHRHGQILPQAAGDPQAAGLVLGRQTVAGLDLQRGDALGQQRPGAGQGAGQQLVFRRGAGGSHGGQDAAAGAGDGLVAGALQPQLELLRAVAAVNQMGVAVHQARRDQGAS